MKTLIPACALLVVPVLAFADVSPQWTPLLDRKLSQFDIYLSYPGTVIKDAISDKPPAGLKPIGLNPPRQDVFTVIEQDGKPVLRISGEIYGCAATRKSYSNFHLRAETKWGEKKWV